MSGLSYSGQQNLPDPFRNYKSCFTMTATGGLVPQTELKMVPGDGRVVEILSSHSFGHQDSPVQGRGKTVVRSDGTVKVCMMFPVTLGLRGMERNLNLSVNI